MWAIGIIAFQMLTGRHPFYFSGDDENSYVKRISKEKIWPLLDKGCAKYGMSELATSFIKRLLARGISDRYRVYQALAHPWITRNDSDPIPLTQNETNYHDDLELKLKHA
jgi:serine/threonine protein kinase